MEEREYRSIYALEETHWWYVGLRALASGFIRRDTGGRRGRGGRGGRGAVVLDAGCGAGAFAKELEEDYRAVGLDHSPLAITLCKKRGIKELVLGSVSTLPFKASSFDFVVSLDVIYHTGVTDDVCALKEFHRVLKDGGAVMLNVPAFEFLRGPHDDVVHTRQRYTRRVLAEKLREAGFTVQRITYWNALLFPAVALVRVARKLFARKALRLAQVSDLGEVPAPLNRLFLLVLKVENYAQRYVNLPFGTSVFCVARKPRAPGG